MAIRYDGKTLTTMRLFVWHNNTSWLTDRQTDWLTDGCTEMVKQYRALHVSAFWREIKTASSGGQASSSASRAICFGCLRKRSRIKAFIVCALWPTKTTIGKMH